MSELSMLHRLKSCNRSLMGSGHDEFMPKVRFGDILHGVTGMDCEMIGKI